MSEIDRAEVASFEANRTAILESRRKTFNELIEMRDQWAVGSGGWKTYDNLLTWAGDRLVEILERTY